ncbi:hypothetical protein C8R45DRAFT_938662 [Mycena sanguinolenta]|nr:hypothetical protein C8R45DRAFT_938662 [Mycena sanguinolenta]
MSDISDTAVLENGWHNLPSYLSKICNSSGRRFMLVIASGMFILGTSGMLLTVISTAVELVVIKAATQIQPSELYRCYMVWGSRRIVLILPGISIITTFLLGYMSIVSNFFTTEVPSIDMRIYLGTSAATNIVLMCLTAGRIWYISRARLSRRACQNGLRRLAEFELAVTGLDGLACGLALLVSDYTTTLHLFWASLVAPRALIWSKLMRGYMDSAIPRAMPPRAYTKCLEHKPLSTFGWYQAGKVAKSTKWLASQFVGLGQFKSKPKLKQAMWRGCKSFYSHVQCGRRRGRTWNTLAVTQHLIKRWVVAGRRDATPVKRPTICTRLVSASLLEVLNLVIQNHISNLHAKPPHRLASGLPGYTQLHKPE